MIRKILIGLGILVGLALSLFALGVYYFSPDGEKVLDFLKENPERTAILLVRNDSVLVKQSVDKVMPLASTVKIILAIAYAEQAASGEIDPEELVSLEELDQLYVANTDGGAHPAWLESIRENVQNERIPLREVAKGMIRYSSNANTEWLLYRLGYDRVNGILDSLGINQHTEIYPIVSALFVGKELFPGLAGEELEGKMKALSPEEYIQSTLDIHQKLINDSTYKKDLGDLSLPIQKIWSDRLPSSTVEDYVSVMEKINRRAYFSKATQQHLHEVLEQSMENPSNQEKYQHRGSKGGSTAFVLTKALYATDKKGNRTEMAYFLNDLSILESTRLQMSMSEFEQEVLENSSFRKKIQERIPVREND
ncbi:serine hydrolase [Algoriphagus sp. oki45]|uniref:serine hydrolase n=1 Tax=Algoriphagus sp. oki45 TaxID=3067294 RepID=UPI0027F42F50|nr:serine hydrolase [Algoriphagus sp. oki45]